MRTIFLCSFLLVGASLTAQHPLLQSGPMLGYTDLREALIWVQTKQAATVQFEYWDASNPTDRHRTEKAVTEKITAYTAKAVADEVEPGKTYEYRLYLNGEEVALPYPTTFKTQVLWQYRTDPPAFTVAAGSCNFVNEEKYDRAGRGYGGTQSIFTKIYEQKPDLMLWLGDNTYYREPDWSTRTGMVHRYTRDRSQAELQPLLASTHHYAIWDDHDYGPNDSDATWAHKEMAWETFRNFWGNPTFGLNGQKGCTTWFQYADVDFFMLDNRYFRTPNTCETCPRTMLGTEQLAWIKGALAASRAPFKIVAIGGQVLNTVKANETYANLFPAERDSILAHIEREEIKGVIFLNGDRHFTEMSALKNAKGRMVYELTSSPLSAGAYVDAPTKDLNELRVPGTAVGEHNFMLLRFSGPRTARQLDVTVQNKEGKVMWTKTLAPSDF